MHVHDLQKHHDNHDTQCPQHLRVLIHTLNIMSVKISVVDNQLAGLVSIAMNSFMGLTKLSKNLFVSSDKAELAEICSDKECIQDAPTPAVLDLLFDNRKPIEQTLNFEAIGTPYLQVKIFDYQKDIVNKCVKEFRGRGIIAAEMGIGKSLIGCVLMGFYSSRSLVLTESTLCIVWKREVKTWLGKDAVIIETGKHKAPSDPETIVICSYDIAKNHDQIKGITWGCIIADESHNLCSMDSIRTRSLISVLNKSERVFLMSGTPEKSRPSDLYPQIYAINKNLFTFEEFTRRYCEGHYNQYNKWVCKGNRNEEELHLILKKFMVRLKSDDVLKLPTLRREYVDFDVDLTKLDEMRIEEKKLMKKFEDAPMNKKEMHENILNAHRQEMLHQSGIAKVNPVLDWFLSEYHKSHTKWVLFAYHKDIMVSIKERLEKEGITHVFVNAEVKADLRPEMLDCITSTSHPTRVAVLSLGTCVKGLTLCPGATKMVMFELVHKPDVLTQAEKRIHRIGCVEEPTVYYTIGKGTVDPGVLGSLRRKRAVNDLIIDNVKRRKSG